MRHVSIGRAQIQYDVNNSRNISLEHLVDYVDEISTCKWCAGYRNVVISP
uniref:Uncharacterized protein n=1 Tax=Parascaris univalens TaxID=6257 RepID=A0A915A6W6_PARUN